MSKETKITIKNLQKKIPVYPIRIKRIIRNILGKEAKQHSGEITVCFVTDKKISELNSKFLNKKNPTDVLAFDTGDIVVSSDTAIRNAAIFKTKPAYELDLYVVHGVLHLLGYDDQRARDIRLMRKKEQNYVNP